MKFHKEMTSLQDALHSSESVVVAHYVSSNRYAGYVTQAMEDLG